MHLVRKTSNFDAGTIVRPRFVPLSIYDTSLLEVRGWGRMARGELLRTGAAGISDRLATLEMVEVKSTSRA